ncbi:MAG TPA: acyl-ACP--UDP-N-acetylglucosamine O-acyltransferase [Gemmatimonadaceae bacterium]|nr:acyl-ACP--UDP-N-acetylglucosamine O-acyltransferase [Gemmatimonadaceae bacterium]
MSARIHPTAIISPDAQLGDGVAVGPWAIIGESCVVGDECEIAARAVLERSVQLGDGVRIGIGSVIGGDPQDLKFQGEHTTVEIGDGTVVREYATINRGTSESLKTTVGRNCFIMTYVHLAHDCHVGDGVIISNGTQLAGHITVGDRATISGLCAIHQFVKVGAYSFIGGASRVPQDIPPYLKAVGNPIRLYGLNTIGLQRANFDPAVLRELKRAYRLFFRSELNVSQAMERANTELELFPEVRHFLSFVDGSGRGVAT